MGAVPSALEKTGDFSDFVEGSENLIPIYDPQTGLQFQYGGRLNVIDPTRISPLAQSIIPSIPDPDRAGLISNKNFAPNTLPHVDHNRSFTLDHNLTPRQSLHYPEGRSSATSNGFNCDPIVGTNDILQSTKNNPSLGRVFLLNYVNAVLPRLVANAAVSWIGEINNQFKVCTGANFAGVQQNIRGAIFPESQFDGQNPPTDWGLASGWTQSLIAGSASLR